MFLFQCHCQWYRFEVFCLQDEKKFSIQFKSGLRERILKIVAPLRSKARRAHALFCLGQPTWRNTLLSGLQLAANAPSNSVIILAKFLPAIAPQYCLHSTTPFPFEMATIKFALFSLPFYLLLRSRCLVLHIFSPFPSFRCSGLVLWTGFKFKPQTIKIEWYTFVPKVLS